MSEWKRIASNRKRICLMLCIPLICLFLFLYRDTMDAMIAPPQEYEILVNVWRDIDPEEILEALSGQYALSENEMRLQAQAEYLLEYPAYLERIQDQANKMIAEEEIYKEAKRQCQEMIMQTKTRMAELRRASNDYMDDALRRTEEAVALSLEDVRDTRAKFKALVEAQEKRYETAVNETEA